MGDLIYRLLLFLNDNREETLNYSIALTMIHNIKDIPNMTINKLADLCYTSPAAISRFCRKLGYSSLSEFKHYLSISLSNNEKGYSRPKNYKDNTSKSREEILDFMYKEANRELMLTKDSLDLKLIDRVIELIYSSNHICFFGTLFSQLISQDLQTKFANLGKLINMATDVQGQEKLTETLTSDSLAILVSPTGRFNLYHDRLWSKIKNSKATIVTITENRDNSYKNDSDYIIYLSQSNYDNQYVPENKYSLTLLMEYIFVRYVDLYFKS